MVRASRSCGTQTKQRPTIARCNSKMNKAQTQESCSPERRDRQLQDSGMDIRFKHTWSGKEIPNSQANEEVDREMMYINPLL